MQIKNGSLLLWTHVPVPAVEDCDGLCGKFSVGPRPNYSGFTHPG